MQNVTTEKAIKNQVASAEMEGIHFDKKALEIIRQYADNEITHEELVQVKGLAMKAIHCMGGRHAGLFICPDNIAAGIRSI